MCEDDILAANALLPDMIGFIFVSDRRRFIPYGKAKTLKALLDPRIKAVGVFIDEAPETVAALCRDGTIDAIQLHGHEDNEYIARLRELTRAPIIRAYRIAGSRDIAEAEGTAADIALLDSGTGTGKVFSWGLISGVVRPYILAGGLDAGNVADAIKTLRPCGVDVSSGIETDGVKDARKMRDFVRAVREADAASDGANKTPTQKKGRESEK